MSAAAPDLLPASQATLPASPYSAGSPQRRTPTGPLGRRRQRGAGSDVDLATCGAEVLDDLYRRHDRMVYRFCLGIMRTPDEAADVAQSTWMQAMVALSAPHIVIRNVPAWLRTIAQNECFDALRARGALRTIDISALEIPGGSTPEDEHATREQLACLLADLQELSERQRRAIVLREVCGLSIDELSDALETTYERASALVADARQTLIRRRDGRALECTDVRRQLRQGRQRSSGLRAHLEVCGPCQGAERRRRGRALSSLGLLPWNLVRPLLERWEAISSAPVAVKSLVAGTLIVASLGTSLPIVAPQSPSRSGASQRSAAPTTVVSGQRATATKAKRPETDRGGRGASMSTAVTAAPAPSPSADRPGEPPTPAPPVPTTTDLPRTAPDAQPAAAGANTTPAPSTLPETVAAADRAVQQTTAALAQVVGKTTDDVVQGTTAVADEALHTTAGATDRTLKKIVSGALQALE